MPTKRRLENIVVGSLGVDEAARHKEEMRENIRNIFNVSIENCETVDELQQLRTLAISLNGLVRTLKEEKDA